MLRYLFILLLLSLYACSGPEDQASTSGKPSQENNQPATTPAPPPLPAKGQIHPAQPLTSMPGHTYALYLPPDFEQGKNWPALYLFDSHARGTLPLKKYKEAAMQAGFVLIASNYSRNGMDWPAHKGHATQLIRETSQNLGLDSRRLYTMGFSGGARVASGLAEQLDNISGAIGSAGGFLKGAPVGPRKFMYIGLAGYADFNYWEMDQLEQSLKQSGHPSHFIFFEGGHEWPPVNAFSEALRILRIREMGQALIPADTAFLAGWRKSIDQYATAKERQGRWIAAWRSLRLLNTLFPAEQAYAARLKALEGNGSFQQARASLEKLMGGEMQQREAYNSALKTPDLKYWQTESMKLKSGGSGDPVTANQNQRMLNYLSLISYMNANGYLKKRQLEPARTFLALYEMVDPENAEHQVLRAELSLQEGKAEAALKYLNNALLLGFRDASRIRTNPLFQPLQSQNGYPALMARMDSLIQAE